MTDSSARLRQLAPPKLQWLIDWLVKVAPILIFFLIWEAASGRVMSASILPPFSAALSQAVAMFVQPDSNLPPYLYRTIYRSLIGIVIATVIGVPLGLGMATNDWLRRQLDPIISITYPSPKSPLIPIIIFWLGVGDLPRIVLATIGAFLPIVLSSFNGVQDVDQEMIWSARSMGLTRVQELFKVVLPSSLPTIMTGVRIGLIFSFIIVISSEMIIAREGIGVLVIHFGQLGQYARVFGIVLWIVLVVAGADRLYLYLSNKHLLSWSEQEVGGI